MYMVYILFASRMMQRKFSHMRSSINHSAVICTSTYLSPSFQFLFLWVGRWGVVHTPQEERPFLRVRSFQSCCGPSSSPPAVHRGLAPSGLMQTLGTQQFQYLVTGGQKIPHLHNKTYFKKPKKYYCCFETRSPVSQADRLWSSCLPNTGF